MSRRPVTVPAAWRPPVAWCPVDAGRGYVVVPGKQTRLRVQRSDDCGCAATRLGILDERAALVGDDEAAVLFVRDLERGDVRARFDAAALLGSEAKASTGDLFAEHRDPVPGRAVPPSAAVLRSALLAVEGDEPECVATRWALQRALAAVE